MSGEAAEEKQSNNEIAVEQQPQPEAAVTPQADDIVAYAGKPVRDFDEMSQNAEQEKQAIVRLKVEALIGSFQTSQVEELKLRSRFAWAIYGVLAVEVAVAATAFFFIGFGLITIPEWVAATFFGAIFAKVAGMILLILRHLFPTQRSPILETIKDL